MQNRKRVAMPLVFGVTFAVAVVAGGSLGTTVAAPALASATEASAGPSEGSLAGIVNATIPDAAIQRQGKEIQLQLSDAVNWNDVVRTLQTGRVRLALLDGSILSLGAGSVMRLTKHDPQTQQTEIELNGGRLRANVVKLTRGGASFEVKTPTAVIGVVGTDFVVLAQGESFTTVYSIEGIVVVRNKDMNVEGLVMLQPGERTTVSRGEPPSTPEAAAPAELQSQIDLTNIGLTGAAQAEGPSLPPVTPTAARNSTPEAATPSEPYKPPPQDVTKAPTAKRPNRMMLLTAVALGVGLVAAIVAVAVSGGK